MIDPDSLRIVTVIGSFALVAAGVKRPVWAVAGYMVMVYCKIAEYYPFFAAMEGELVFGVAILIRVLLSRGAGARLSLSYNPVNKYLLWFALSICISFAFAIDYEFSWENGVYQYIKVLFLYLMIVGSVESEKDLRVFIWLFVAMYVYLTYEPVYGLIYGVGGKEYMYGTNYVAEKGILSGHVALANNMNEMIPIAFFLFLSVGKKWKVLALVPLVIFVVGVIGSGSRGGVVGFMAFAATLVFFSKNRAKTAMILGTAVLILLVGSGRMSSTYSRIGSSSAEGRLMGLIHGIEMVRVKYRLFGVGPGCYRLARSRYFGYTMDAHNLYGELIGELGIPGTIAWVLFIVQVFKNLQHSRARLGGGVGKKEFIHQLTMGLLVSLVVRLFISMASHGLDFFYWYVVGALSMTVAKLSDKVASNAEEDAERRSEKTGALSKSIRLAGARQMEAVD
jgi:hypothetical protein